MTGRNMIHLGLRLQRPLRGASRLPTLVRCLQAARKLNVLQWHFPPPYASSPPEFALSAPIGPPSLLPGLQDLLATKESLLGHIDSLNEVLSLKRELKELTQQIQTLQADLTETSSTPKIGTKKQSIQRLAPAVSLSFPVMTHSAGRPRETGEIEQTEETEEIEGQPDSSQDHGGGDM